MTPSKMKVAHTALDLACGTKHDLEEEVGGVLYRLSTSAACTSSPRRPAPGETQPRYEIFHFVFGAVVLDWRLRHDQERKMRALAVRVEQEKAASPAADLERQPRLRARTTRPAAVSFGVLTIGLAAVGFGVLTMGLAAAVLWASPERRVANSRELAVESQAALSTDPKHSAAPALAALGHDETSEAEDALRTTLETRVWHAVDRA